MSGEVTQVVNVLADLAATNQRRTITSVDADLVEWLPMSYANLLAGRIGFRIDKSDEGTRTFFNTDTTRRIFKTAKLRGGDDEGDVLRVGWLWLAGRHGEHGQVLTPLVSLPVMRTPGDVLAGKVTSMLSLGRDDHADVTELGEAELTDLISDDLVRRKLGMNLDLDPSWEESPDVIASRSSVADASALRAWAFEAAAAAGCVTDVLVAAKRVPEHAARNRRLVVVAGVGLYVAPPQRKRAVTGADTLRSWESKNLDDTALAALYDDTVARERDDIGLSAPSPFELNAAQQHAVESVARERLTVLSGPPGTGKSQTVAAVAFDQVRRGRSVLVVAPTNASVAALTALMEGTPGPDPMVFGSTTHRREVASRLTEHASFSHDRDVVERRRDVDDRARGEVERLRAAVVALLAAERAATVDPTELLLARAEAPGVFEYGADLDRAQELADALVEGESRRSWRRRRSTKRDLARLRELCRARDEESVAVLAGHVALAVAQSRNADLAMSGGLDLGHLWDSLIDATDRMRHSAGALLEATTHQRDNTDRKSQRAIATVAAALRSGRARRREMLADVDAAELLEPLPLWLSTLRDVDDLLPMRPGMFDLVIIDEASHIDQVSAAPALLRGKSALVVGDPRQLRHVSFVSAERIEVALAKHGLSSRPVAAQLDVQATSLFDAAVSVQPPLLLDEHYRSVPHLIDFSAERFYDGRVGVATRHPRNEHEDSIEVVEVDGERNTSGVNAGEIAAIVKLLRSRDLTVDRGSVGVITPFRAQAEALEPALRDAFELSEIDRLDLRVGTVHGFQGCQRDVTYLSMGVDDRSPAGSRSFIDDAALFNVMVTRARRSVVVVTSAKGRLPTLLADYIRHGDAPEIPTTDPDAGGAVSHWPRRVVAELRDGGLGVRTGYPVGRHQVDAVVGSGAEAIGIICGVHPDGPESHVDRHLELSRLGWSIREVFESQWGEQLPALAVELRSSLA